MERRGKFHYFVLVGMFTSAAADLVRVMTHHSLLRNGLRVVWILAVVWLELGTFNFALHDCRWPDTRQVCVLSLRSGRANERLAFNQPHTPNARIVRILVIADPQIIDRHSYPGRGPLLSALSQYVVDLNLRKSWNSAFRRLRPNAVVVLGTFA